MWFIPLFVGFQPSKVVHDFATIHSMSSPKHEMVLAWHLWSFLIVDIPISQLDLILYIYINRYIYIYIHTQSPFWYGIFCLVWLRLDYTQPSPISHIPSAECPQKSLCDSPQNCPRIPKTAICGLSEPNSFGEVVAGSTGKIPGLDDHECIAGSRMWCYTFILPRCSMYGIFTNICPKNHPNVGKYTIHGAYGLYII